MNLSRMRSWGWTPVCTNPARASGSKWILHLLLLDKLINLPLLTKRFGIWSKYAYSFCVREPDQEIDAARVCYWSSNLNLTAQGSANLPWKSILEWNGPLHTSICPLQQRGKQYETLWFGNSVCISWADQALNWFIYPKGNEAQQTLFCLFCFFYFFEQQLCYPEFIKCLFIGKNNQIWWSK